MEGLRTLIMCQRTISPDEFLTWHKRWKEVQLSNSTDKEIKLDILGAELENNLELVGASAIEDKLQDGVPETIALLIEAGIRVWVLTGDKQETAVEIGKACNLITNDMKLLDLTSVSKSELLGKLETYNTQYVLFT
jgi:magnesium-transporting ATPase (P-type)